MKALYALRLGWSFFLALVRANLAVARVVLSPRPRLAPGILRVPIKLRTDTSIAALANMITLTPGTLTVAVSEERDCLYVHSIGNESPEQVRSSIGRDMEAHLERLER